MFGQRGENRTGIKWRSEKIPAILQYKKITFGNFTSCADTINYKPIPSYWLENAPLVDSFYISADTFQYFSCVLRMFLRSGFRPNCRGGNRNNPFLAGKARRSQRQAPGLRSGAAGVLYIYTY